MTYSFEVVGDWISVIVSACYITSVIAIPLAAVLLSTTRKSSPEATSREQMLFNHVLDEMEDKFDSGEQILQPITSRVS